MATIELSAGLLSYGGYNGFLYRTLADGQSYAQVQNSTLFGAATGINARFKIMKGTIPTNFSTLTTESSRSSDVLISFSSYQVSYQSNPVNISTPFTAASATGTASWFWIYTYNQVGYMAQQAIGTIGATGSGSDLEIVSTTITSGQLYRIANFRLQMPTTWSY